MTVSDALPNRPLSRNELYDLQKHEGIRHTIPQDAPLHGNERGVACAMIIGESQSVAVGFDEESESWLEIHREPTPDDAFMRDYITDEDHDHPEIQRLVERMQEWDDSN